MSWNSAEAPPVRLLGGVEVSGPDGPVSAGGPKARAVLAMLVLADDAVVSVDRLVDGVWGEEAPSSVHNTLQVHVSAVRKTLTRSLGPPGDAWSLQSSAGGYRLVLPTAAVDVRVFTAAVAAADTALMRGRYDEARSEAAAAIALWQGPPLAGLDDPPFASAEAARLDAAMLVARELWADASLAIGRPQDVVPALERVLAEHPFTEALWRRQMLALYRTGRQAEALAAFEHLRGTLADELGLDPSPDLVALQQAVLRQDPGLQPAAPAGVVDGPAPPEKSFGPLPWFGNPLVGRGDEVAEIVRHLAAGIRMVTVLGPGGAGKTRLAVEATRRTAEAGGVRTAFVDASFARSVEAILQEMAGVVGASGDAPLFGMAEAITVPTVITLDNADQLAAELRPALGAVLEACPLLQLLVTSRVATDVDGELRLVLGPLSEADATMLFEDRARKVLRTFSLEDPATLEAVRAIARRVDSLPLALELAAAQLRLMPLQHVRAHLERSVLALSGSSALPTRRRSVREIVRWSVELLQPENARALRLLAVCEGGFTLEIAEAILGSDVGDVLGALADLVDNSLVVGPAMEEALSSTDQAPRFRLLQPIRDFGLEELEAAGETELARSRLARYFLDQFVDERRAALRLDESLATLRHELPNLMASLECLADEEPSSCVHLLVATARAMFVTGQLSVVSHFADVLLTLPNLSLLDQARVGVLAGVTAYGEGDRARAIEQLESGLRVLLGHSHVGYPLVIGGGYLMAALADEGRHGEAADLSQRVLDLVLETGEEEWVSTVLDAAQYAARLAGDVERALVLARAGVDNAVRGGDRAVEALRRESLAHTLMAAGLLDEAVDEGQRALEAADTSVGGNRAVAAAIRGRVLAVRGRCAEAVACLLEVVRSEAATGYATREMSWLALALVESDPPLAARLLGAALVQEDLAELPSPDLVGSTLVDLEQAYPSEVERGRQEGWLVALRHLESREATFRREQTVGPSDGIQLPYA